MTEQNYSNQEFIEIRFGPKQIEIPRDWHVEELKKIVSKEKGGKPDRLFGNTKENTYPYLSADFMRSGNNVLWCSKNDSNIKIVKKNEIIMIWDGSYSGHVFTGFEGALSSTMVKIRSNSDKLDNKFLYYFLGSKAYPILRTTTTGTSIPHVSRSVFERFLIPLPPINEQKKISKILSTVDHAIDQTDEIIKKSEFIKKGLMQNLLTKGISHNDYKKFKLGPKYFVIPENWEIDSIGNTSYLKGRIGWQGLTTDEYLDSGQFYLVTGTDFEKGRIKWDSCFYVDKDRYERDSNIQLRDDDVLITKDGTLGKVAYVNKLPGPATLNSGIFVLRPFDNEYIPKFMFYILKSKYFKNFMCSLGAGSTISHLYQKDFVNFKFPIPPISEQKKIIDILSRIDTKIKNEVSYKQKLEQLKKGLMQDFLTGKKRVTVENT